MKMRTDNEDVNKILDLSMSGSMSGGPISYTADCMHDAPSITPSTCTADMGCMAMKINVCYTAVGEYSTTHQTIIKRLLCRSR